MKEHNIHVRFIKISSNSSGQRIDNFLFIFFKKVPRSMIYRIIRIGAVRVNRKRVKFQYRLNIGDYLKIPIIRQRKTNILNTKNFLKEIKFLCNTVMYEDDYLLAINKPSGVAVHGGSGVKFGIIEGLRALRPNASFLELVHRLDRATSGILLIAKKRTALVYLHEQLRLNKMQKKYLALVHGAWNVHVKTISIPLLRKNTIINSSVRKVPCNIQVEKLAVTHFDIQESFSDIATLLIVRPVTGRTHQIRIHTKFANHPIVGDDMYGNKKFNIIFEKYGCNRLFLHACALSFYHPKTKKIFHMHASLEQSLNNCLYCLRDLIYTDRMILNNHYKQY